MKRFVTPYGDLVRIIHEFYGFRSSLSKAEQTMTQGTTWATWNSWCASRRGRRSRPRQARGQRRGVPPPPRLRPEGQRHPPRAQARQRHGALPHRRRPPRGVHHPQGRLPGHREPHQGLSRAWTSPRSDGPQDGRIKTERDGKEVELRISTVPVAFGEKIVMRIFDPDMLIRDLASLGFRTRARALRGVHRPAPRHPAGHRPHGIRQDHDPLLGPQDPRPARRQHRHHRGPHRDGHAGAQPDRRPTKIGLTFASALRTLLRQDPDIIMVGEIRDLETAENAVQAALTGHLVLSTLHTNDAPSAITRLQDLGIPPSSSPPPCWGSWPSASCGSSAPAARRTTSSARRSCASWDFRPRSGTSLVAKRGKGCVHCRKTGYFGRTGIYEMLKIDDQMRDLIDQKADSLVLREHAIQNGMMTLKEAALSKLVRGSPPSRRSSGSPGFEAGASRPLAWPRWKRGSTYLDLL